MLRAGTFLLFRETLIYPWSKANAKLSLYLSKKILFLLFINKFLFIIASVT